MMITITILVIIYIYMYIYIRNKLSELRTWRCTLQFEANPCHYQAVVST